MTPSFSIAYHRLIGTDTSEAPVSNIILKQQYDGYRMHARIDGGDIKLLTRTGLDWSHRYRRTIEALGALKLKSAYLDGELCALNGDGVPVFSRLQAAMDEGRTFGAERGSLLDVARVGAGTW
jgi:ATP-dependent DNA ligase